MQTKPYLLYKLMLESNKTEWRLAARRETEL